VPGETFMGAVGNALSYSFTFPEAEERSPWVPLHVQKGFKPDDSTATVFLGGWYKKQSYLWPARPLAGKVSALLDGERSVLPAADRDGPDRRQGFRQARLRL
jgi:hypothetical protein